MSTKDPIFDGLLKRDLDILNVQKIEPVSEAMEK